MEVKLTRRDFIKSNAVAAAAVSAGVAAPGILLAQERVSCRGHWYAEWTPDGDGTHGAGCLREGCRFAGTAACTGWACFSKLWGLTASPAWTASPGMPMATRNRFSGSFHLMMPPGR